jgi:Ca2+-binding EF-hand superfamily protein
LTERRDGSTVEKLPVWQLDEKIRRFTMKKFVALGLSFSLCLTLAGALNAGATEICAGMQGDANRDGFMTCSEAKSFAVERFTAMDRTGDKRLSIDEMETAMANIHKLMDTNGDRQVNVQEYVSYWCGVTPRKMKGSARGNKQPQFQKMDSNRDGKISSGECLALWTVRFHNADENRDGRLTTKEYVQSIIIWFADMDPNRDSLVTMSEWNSYWIGRCK